MDNLPKSTYVNCCSVSSRTFRTSVRRYTARVVLWYIVHGTRQPNDVCVVTVGKKNVWEFIHLCCVIFMLEEKLEVLVELNFQTFLLFYYFPSGLSTYWRRIKRENPFTELSFKMLTINRCRSVGFSVILSLFQLQPSTPFSSMRREPLWHLSHLLRCTGIWRFVVWQPGREVAQLVGALRHSTGRPGFISR